MDFKAELQVIVVAVVVIAVVVIAIINIIIFIIILFLSCFNTINYKKYFFKFLRF